MLDPLVILDMVSIFIMGLISLILCFQTESYMQKFASYACIMMMFTSVGFLLKAESGSLNALVFGQRIIYCFVAHGVFSMLLFILAYCRYEAPRWLISVCVGIDVVISVLAMTIPYNQLFYKSYWAVEEGGKLVLEKEYAFGHTFAMGVLILYMLATIVIAIVYAVNNIRRKSRYVIIILLAVLIPYSAYLIPKITGTTNDYQPITFALFQILVLLMIYRNNLYDVNNILTKYSVASVNDGVIVLDAENRFEGCNGFAEKLFPALKDVSFDIPITNELPELKEYLDGEKKDLILDGRIYELSNREILNNGVSVGKTLWFTDVTLNRNYTYLLETQKKSLENQMVTLSDYSYKDQMTGLKNRRCYEEEIEKIRNSNGEEKLLVWMFDVNGLKNTNDTIGHLGGDELIRGAASIIDQVFGNEGTVFRIGGDEFFAIMKDPVSTVEELQEMLKKAEENWSGTLVKEVSVACGYAGKEEFPDKNIDELSIIADKRMYEDKKKYHGQVR